MRSVDAGRYSLAGKTALVTGASRGIGAAIAKVIAANGARVAVVARNTDMLNAVARDIADGMKGVDTQTRQSEGKVTIEENANHSEILVFSCDLTNTEEVAKLSANIQIQFGGVPDILVNNAGVFGLEPLSTLSLESFTKTLDINLTAPFRLINAFLPGMLKRGSGDVINIGSIADRLVMAENGPYSAAKFGLRALTEVLRSETRGSGVRVTLVSPAATNTALWDDLLANPKGRSLPPREVMMDVSAVADAIFYVLSQPASVNIDELRLSHS